MANRLTREMIDRHFNRLRRNLFTLAEAALPEGQQEAFKLNIKVHTQAAWRGIACDAGLADPRVHDEDALEEHVTEG